MIPKNILTSGGGSDDTDSDGDGIYDSFWN